MKHKTQRFAKRWLMVALCLCVVFTYVVATASAQEEPPAQEEQPVAHEEAAQEEQPAEQEEPALQSGTENEEGGQGSETGNNTKQENVSVGNMVYTLRSDGTAAVTDGKFDSSGYITIPAQIQVDGEAYTVTEVAEKAFYDASSAEGITLPETLRVIGAKAFYNAASYIRGTNAVLTIPDSVAEIGEGAFAQNDFDKIIIGDGLEKIPSGAFKGISFMTDDVELVIGSKVTSISTDAFDDGTVTKVTVKGETGRLDTVLEQVNGLKKAEITYDDPNALTSDWLQGEIAKAEDGKQTTITIDASLRITDTVTVPAGKDILLINNGKTRTLISQTGQMFEVKGKLTIDATAKPNRLVFKGGKTQASSAGNIATITDGGELILKDGVFCNGSIERNYSGAVLVDKNSRFEMTGGVIKNFTLKRSVLTGTVVVASGGGFRMSGGSIEENTSTSRRSGGGVLLYAWNKNDADATMTMSGDAVIRSNTSSYDGGGVYLIGNTDFKMTGGTITNNKANGGHGGGVCVAGTGDAAGVTAALANDTKFTMTGGEISGNHTNNCGGGIYINSDDVELKGGKIENNTAGRQGGGIYVSEPPQKAMIYNAVITGNEASVMGGGLWFCPTGDATFAVTNGVAVYDNKANGAGDDFVSLKGGSGVIKLTDRFLGGGPVEWYRDGAVIGQTGGGPMPPVNVLGTVDDKIPRFDPANPGERLTDISGSGNYALKAVVSDNTKKLAESQAKLWITGNKAARGGGIGSNGGALIGEDNDYELKVTKKWSENTPETEKKEITVFLKIGEYKLDSVKLNRENGWTACFKQLPDPESLEGKLQYAVVEDPVPDSFIPVYKDAVIDNEKKTIIIEIENEYVPENPYVKVTSVRVTKAWMDNGNQDGIRPDSITVKLLADGKDTGKTLVLSSSNNWTGVFTGLDRYRDSGEEIVYTIEEVSVKGYESVITGSASAGFVVTNSHTHEETDLSGSKMWDDDGDRDGKRPDSITIRLYANGEQIRVVTVTAEDGWKWKFDNLPKYENGKEIIYTITEDATPGYQSETDGMDVINHYTPGRINIPVTKNWKDCGDADGIRPDSITVKLYADGKYTGRKLILDKKNKWTGSFDNLYEYADGKKIVYTVVEDGVDGYDASVSGSVKTGFVISNSHIPGAPKDDNPKTGDTAGTGLWTGLMVISAAGLAAMIIRKKKCWRGKK